MVETLMRVGVLQLDMDHLRGVVLLVCVCALLVVVSGAVESGKVTGFNYTPNLSFLKGIVPPGLVTTTTTISQGNSTGGSHGNTTVGSQGNSQGSGGGSLSAGVSLPPVLSDFLRVLPTWFLAVIAVAFFGGACLLILRIKTSEHVLDLEGTLEEMEQQRKYLEETWSYKLRNAALLRYYLLMRRACVKVGLRDEPAETPKEYVERVSSFFNVEKSEAAKFASAVNRSRYGEELSEQEAGEASKFMSAFSGIIRLRAGESK